jgi:hypothetical protein
MADEQLAARTKRTEQGPDVINEMAQLVGFTIAWTARVTIAAHIGCNDMPAETSKWNELVAPRDAAFWKTVKQKCDVVPPATFVASECNSVGLNVASGGLKLVRGCDPD